MGPRSDNLGLASMTKKAPLPTRPRRTGGRQAGHGIDPARRRRTARTVGAGAGRLCSGSGSFTLSSGPTLRKINKSCPKSHADFDLTNREMFFSFEAGYFLSHSGEDGMLVGPSARPTWGCLLIRNLALSFHAAKGRCSMFASPDSSPDQILAQRCTARDSDAWRELQTRYAGLIRNYYRIKEKDPDQAEELGAIFWAFLISHDRLKAYETARGSLDRYLLALANDQWRQHRRKKNQSRLEPLPSWLEAGLASAETSPQVVIEDFLETQPQRLQSYVRSAYLGIRGKGRPPQISSAEAIRLDRLFFNRLRKYLSQE